MVHRKIKTGKREGKHGSARVSKYDPCVIDDTGISKLNDPVFVGMLFGSSFA